jgi:tetratricopeptide (TPR) repeat protein
LRVGGPQSSVHRRAIALFREAVERDTTFAAAWAHMSQQYINLFTQGVSDAGLADSADVTSVRALALAPGLAISHQVRASYYSDVLGDPTRGIAESEAAVALEPRNTRALATLASDEVGLSRWDAGIGHFLQALQLDPRDLGAWISLGEAQVRLHHVSEARTSFAHAVALRPNRIDVVQDQMTMALMQGDLASAQALVAGLIQASDSASVVTYMATYNDLGWVLDSAESRYLLSLGPSAFDGDRAQWAFSRAEQFATMDDRARMRIWADTARIEYEAQLKQYPGDPQRVADHAIALAYLGRKAEAISEGQRAVTLEPVAKNSTIGPYVQHQLVRVYLALGENDAAMDRIEKLLPIPYFLTAPRMRIDPEFSALKGNPRFEKILATAKPLS